MTSDRRVIVTETEPTLAGLLHAALRAMDYRVEFVQPDALEASYTAAPAEVLIVGAGAGTERPSWLEHDTLVVQLAEENEPIWMRARRLKRPTPVDQFEALLANLLPVPPTPIPLPSRPLKTQARRSDIGIDVLVVEPIRALRNQLIEAGNNQLIAVHAVACAQAARQCLADTSFDVVFVSASVDGADALLKSVGNARVVWVSRRSDFKARLSAARAGASLYLHAPMSTDAFVSAVRQQYAAQLPERISLLLVGDVPIAVQLEKHGIEVVHATDGASALEILPEFRPDAVLASVTLTDATGAELCRLLRSASTYQTLPVFLAGHSDQHVTATRAGADGFLATGEPIDGLIARIRICVRQAQIAVDRADRDALTGLMVRRAFNDVLRTRLADARRGGRITSFGVLDLDHFKAVNDQHGHLVGDEVLLTLAQQLTSEFRTGDLRARWGGEEFVVAFNNESPRSAHAILDRVRRNFAQHVFQGAHDQPFKVTFSAGVAVWPADGDTIETLFQAADRRLYAAKKAGRNQVCSTDC